MKSSVLTLRKPIPLARAIRWFPAGLFTPPRTLDDLALFITQSALRDVMRHLRSDPEKELLGFLLGELYECPDTGARYVVVNSAVRTGYAIAESDRILIPEEEWLGVQLEVRRRRTQLMGWYHSAPFVGPHPARADLETHRALFTEPWQCGLVIATSGDKPTGAFFRSLMGERTGGGVLVPFYELADEDEPIPADGRKRTLIDWVNYETRGIVERDESERRPFVATPPPTPRSVPVILSVPSAPEDDDDDEDDVVDDNLVFPSFPSFPAATAPAPQPSEQPQAPRQAPAPSEAQPPRAPQQTQPQTPAYVKPQTQPPAQPSAQQPAQQPAPPPVQPPTQPPAAPPTADSTDPTRAAPERSSPSVIPLTPIRPTGPSSPTGPSEPAAPAARGHSGMGSGADEDARPRMGHPAGAGPGAVGAPQHRRPDVGRNTPLPESTEDAEDPFARIPPRTNGNQGAGVGLGAGMGGGGTRTPPGSRPGVSPFAGGGLGKLPSAVELQQMLTEPALPEDGGGGLRTGTKFFLILATVAAVALVYLWNSGRIQLPGFLAAIPILDNSGASSPSPSSPLPSSASPVGTTADSASRAESRDTGPDLSNPAALTPPVAESAGASLSLSDSTAAPPPPSTSTGRQPTSPPAEVALQPTTSTDPVAQRFAALADTLEGSIRNFQDRNDDFAVHRITCDGLAVGYRAADDAFIALASAHRSASESLDPASEARYRELVNEMGKVNEEFEASKCPRP